MTEKEEYEMLRRYYRRLQQIMKKNGEVPLTEEEVEKEIRLAMEGHKRTMTMEKLKKDRIIEDVLLEDSVE